MPDIDSVKGAVADRLAPFGTTIFATMSALAAEHDAVNLSQGFPDFDGPDFVKRAAAEAMAAGANQYPPMMGIAALREAVAARWESRTGVAVDPASEVTVTSGCTEALAATFLGLINPGDEVVLFEPFYDSYRANVVMAGGTARFVTLRANAETGRFGFDADELRAAFTAKTRAILVNTPHNPTGMVFTREELELIAGLCVEHDVLAITDEVYEDLVFDEARPHIRLATLPGMRERTLTLSSLGKTFSLTGWKIGWVVAPAELSRGVRSAHQFLTFTTASPLQHGAAAALREGESYVSELVAGYAGGRRLLCDALRELGFGVFEPDGTYFIMADHSAFGFEDDVAFCTHLTRDIGVAAIPPSVFYENPQHGKHLVRFAFCKREVTLHEAVRRMGEGLRAE